MSIKAYFYAKLGEKEEQKSIMFILESFGSLIIKSKKDCKNIKNTGSWVRLEVFGNIL